MSSAATASSQAWLSRSIDTMKGIAILGVVMFHFFADHGALLLGPWALEAPHWQARMGALFQQFTHIGSQGIHVFFLLSGFGIAWSESRAMLAPGAFLRRRLGRLFPAFLLSMLLVCLLLLTTGQAVMGPRFLFEVAINASLLRNYSEDWIHTLNGNWWFVAAIVPMYLMHLLVRRQVVARPLTWAIAAYLVSFAWKAGVSVGAAQAWIEFDAGRLNPWTAFFLNYWWEFVLGAALYRLGWWQRLHEASTSKLLCIIAIGLVAEVAGVVLGASEIGRVFNDDLFALAQWLLWIPGLILLDRATGDHNWRVLRFIGVVSYPLYLIHHPLSRSLPAVGLEPSTPVGLLLTFGMYCLVCIGLAYVIDRAVNGEWRLPSMASHLPGVR